MIHQKMCSLCGSDQTITRYNIKDWGYIADRMHEGHRVIWAIDHLDDLYIGYFSWSNVDLDNITMDDITTIYDL